MNTYECPECGCRVASNIYGRLTYEALTMTWCPNGCAIKLSDFRNPWDQPIRPLCQFIGGPFNGRWMEVKLGARWWQVPVYIAERPIYAGQLVTTVDVTAFTYIRRQQRWREPHTGRIVELPDVYKWEKCFRA